MRLLDWLPGRDSEPPKRRLTLEEMAEAHRRSREAAKAGGWKKVLPSDLEFGQRDDR